MGGAIKEAYKDISRFPDASPVTWKFSGGKNDKGVWSGRGMIGKRRDGRTARFESVEGGRRFGGRGGPD